jgi:TonB family protein
MHWATMKDSEVGTFFGWTRRFRLVLITIIVFVTPCFGQSGRRVVSNPSPVYPPLARTLNLKGTVKIEVLIAANGVVRDTRVIGGHPVLVDASLTALKKWKYEPGGTETKELVTFRF